MGHDPGMNPLDFSADAVKSWILDFFPDPDNNLILNTELLFLHSSVTMNQKQLGFLTSGRFNPNLQEWDMAMGQWGISYKCRTVWIEWSDIITQHLKTHTAEKQ